MGQNLTDSLISHLNYLEYERILFPINPTAEIMLNFSVHVGWCRCSSWGKMLTSLDGVGAIDFGWSAHTDKRLVFSWFIS